MSINTNIKREYWSQQIRSNNIYYLIVCTFTFLTETFLALIYTLKPKPQFSMLTNRHFYFLSFGILLSFLFAIAFWLFRKKLKILSLMHFLFLALLLVWSCLFATFNIQQEDNGYILTYALIITSAGIRLPNQLHCAINFTTLFTFATLLGFLQINEAILFEIVIQCFIVYVLCTIIIVYLNRLHFSNFQMRMAVETKNQQLYYLAHFDELTKIPNRRMVTKYLANCIQETKGNLCCILIDVDDFKKYNDTYGHIAGDQLLTHIASILKRYADQYNGMVGRYGGEEYLFILQNYSSEEINQIMYEILQSIRADQAADGISISAGGCMRQANSTVGSMIFNADTAMYQVKTSGKDNFLMYTPK